MASGPFAASAPANDDLVWPSGVLAAAPKTKLHSCEIWRAGPVYNEVRVFQYRGYLWLAFSDLSHSHATL